MKKVFLLIIVGVFLFSYCSRPRPEIEPGKTGKPAETVEKKDETAQVETAEKTGDQDVTAAGKTDVKPLDKEEIPIIEPVKPRIKAGFTITDVFKDFGYSGEIAVPASFEKRVEHYVQYFISDEKGYRFFLRAITRSKNYLPTIKKVLAKKHLPEFLAYLPLIESGFNPNARSRAGAVGMWQFMSGTARMYGLKITRYKDDRRDWLKATYAASEYLNDLLSMFGVEDPFLGICAYNAGEGKILRALRKISFKERSFWTLVGKGLLRNETNEYIPRIIAAVMIAKNPQKYDMAAGVVAVGNNEEEDLEVIAQLHSTKDDLKEEPAAVIEMDKVTEEAGETNVEALSEAEKVRREIAAETGEEITPPQRQETANYILYKVRRKDTLYAISKKYDVTVKNLKKWNGLRYNRIYPGQKLKIYGHEPEEPVKTVTAAKIQRGSKGCKLVYTVNYTDSLARIALFFGSVSARDIMHWNGLRHTRIYPRQKLIVYLKDPPRKVVTHVVKRGETAKEIAAKYGVRLEYILSLNGMLTDTRLKPGKKLSIYYF